MSEGLTVFLGGAGMNGGYQKDMVTSLKNAGIQNAIYGNYSAWFQNFDKRLYPVIDTLGDASGVIFYNQDDNDPIGLQFVNTTGCQLDKEYKAYGLALHQYSGKNQLGKSCPKYVFRYELDTPRNNQFTLSSLEINTRPPKQGQFNLIGYSWGAVISARTALYYARKGTKIDHLVLVGAPINFSLLLAVKNHINIKKTIVVDLQNQGDPIYAGMSDIELIKEIPTLALQMNSKKGQGHFYYSMDDGVGKSRRRQLADHLYMKGLR